MKRKVKFQEGGAVEEPARRPTRESPRNRRLRETMEKFGREGGRLRAAERARERQLAERDATRQSQADRRDIARFNDRVDRAMPVTPEEARRLGAEPARPRPTMAQASQQVMRPPSPSATSTAGRVAGGLAGAAISGAALVPGMVDYGREVAARRGAEADAQREANLRALRNREVNTPADGPAAGSMQSAPAAPARPAPRPAARPAPAPAPRPRFREMTADELNEMELRRIRAERQMEEDDARERLRRREEMMGGSGNIGAASARERGEQVGPPGDYNMKKGGIVKKKAGGMIAAKPKKMMKGGVVAKPKVAAKSKTKPMPFKKGGVIKKEKK